MADGGEKVLRSGHGGTALTPEEREYIVFAAYVLSIAVPLFETLIIFLMCVNTGVKRRRSGQMAIPREYGQTVQEAVMKLDEPLPQKPNQPPGGPPPPPGKTKGTPAQPPPPATPPGQPNPKAPPPPPGNKKGKPNPNAKGPLPPPPGSQKGKPNPTAKAPPGQPPPPGSQKGKPNPNAKGPPGPPPPPPNAQRPPGPGTPPPRPKSSGFCACCKKQEPEDPPLPLELLVSNENHQPVGSNI